MKKILFLFVLGLFYGCGPSKAELDRAVAEAVASKITDSTNITVVVSDDIKISKIAQIMKPDGQGGGSIRFLSIDGHDYMQWYSDGGVGAMCHNENCTNETHIK